jgi:hypothetical protein
LTVARVRSSTPSTSYQNANYGPMWGDTNEREADSLTRALVALYAKHNIPSDDRLAGL